jgi:predicted RNA-binding protein YlqC (UPF0109 family)
MKEILLYLLQQLVSHPQQITIEETLIEERTIFTVHANPDDLGKIIGRNGRIIRAIRDLIKIVAAKHNTYVDVVLAEE